MKEITFRIPDDSTDLITELVEKLGGSVDKKKRINNGIKNSAKKKKRNIKTSNRQKGDSLPLFGKYPPLVNRKPKKQKLQSNKKIKKEKIDHTYLFGKWKDFDIDAEKLRKEVWSRD